MSVIEERKIKIPTCHLEKSDLKNICEIIENESNIIKKENSNSSVSLIFQIESKETDFQATTMESFLNTRFPKKIEEIRITMISHTISQEIWLKLDFESTPDSYLRVKGRDSTWVNGVLSKLEHIFNDKKTKNYVFRNSYTRFPIVLALGILLGLGVTSLSLAYYPEIYNKDNPYDLTITVTMFSFPALFFFFGWLFPQIEYENYLIQTRMKKTLLSILGSIVVGMILLAFSKLWS